MKKRSLISVLATATLASLLVTGCSSTEAPHAAVYVDESQAATQEAGAAQTLSVIPDLEDLVEPELPEPVVPEKKADEEKPAEKTGDAPAADQTEPPSDADRPESAETDEDPDHLEILFLGDSQYANARGTDTAIPEFIDVMIDKNCTIYNLAIGGSAAALGPDERYMSDDAWTSASFYGMARLLNGHVPVSFLETYYPDLVPVFNRIDPKKLDYIIVDYGVNDFFNVTQIYDEEDTGDLSDFVAAYRESLGQLREAAPQAKILCCTPVYSQFFGKDGAYLGDGNILSNGYGALTDYVSAIDVNYRLESNTIYVDMYRGNRIDLDPYTAEEYLEDGVHLTERGRRAYAAALAQLINKDQGTQTTEYQIVRIADY